MSAIGETLALSAYSTIGFGVMNMCICLGTRKLEWVTPHSSIESGIAGSLAGLGNGLNIISLIYFSPYLDHFWKMQHIKSPKSRWMIEQIAFFLVPFLPPIVFTKPLGYLVGQTMTFKILVSYAFFDSVVSLFVCHSLKSL